MEREQAPGAKKRPAEGREARVPRPPSPEAIETISREQELLTDEWTGEGPSPGARPGGAPASDANSSKPGDGPK